MKRVYETVEYMLNLNDVPLIVCKSLVFEVLFKGMLYEKEFKKNLKVYIKVYEIYGQLVKMIEQIDPDPNAKDIVLVKEVPNVFNHIVTAVTASLHTNFSSPNLSENFNVQLGHLIGLLRGVSAPNMLAFEAK
jgi:hypothetical protein